MAEMINLKAVVDRESNKVMFIEADADLIDVLFSFLTIPTGTIVRQAFNHSIPVEIGCFRNLYESVEKFDVLGFRSKECKDMLLVPYNAASYHFKNFKLEIGNYLPTRLFSCSKCGYLPGKTLSYYSNILCYGCFDESFPLSYWKEEVVSLSVDDTQDGCVFVKGRPRLIFTDDLQVIPPISAASMPLFTKLGVTDTKTTEELTFNIGVEEVMNLLMNSLVSKTPLTETLLKHKHIPLMDHLNSNQGISIDPQMLGDAMNVEARDISVKLVVSKSKKMVCYAEAREDFVNLLFSFLTLPLGFIVEKIRNGSWKGCADQLYKSVNDLDEQYLKSSYHKELLVNPKLAPGFSYKNPLLGIEQASIYCREDILEGTIMISTDQSKICTAQKCYLLDPKSRDDQDENVKGFLKGPATFTVTDNLVVRPVSPIFQMSVLQDLKVPFTDIEDRIVYMGKEEALRLLVASFVGESALTNTFLTNLTIPKQENDEDAYGLACSMKI